MHGNGKGKGKAHQDVLLKSSFLVVCERENCEDRLVQKNKNEHRAKPLNGRNNLKLIHQMLYLAKYGMVWRCTWYLEPCTWYIFFKINFQEN